jgi:hypothetical protein
VSSIPDTVAATCFATEFTSIASYVGVAVASPSAIASAISNATADCARASVK